MKICFITNRFANNNDILRSKTGRTINLIAQLKKRNEICLVLYDSLKLNKLDSYIKEKNTDIYTLEPIKNKLLNVINLYEKLERIIIKERPDYIIYSRDIFISLLANTLSKRYKIQTVFELIDNYTSYKGWMNNSLIQNYLINHSDYIICVSKRLESYVKIINPKAKTYFLPNGLNKIRVLDTNRINRARKRLGLPFNKKILIYSGGLEKNRNIGILLKALKILKKKRQDLLLIIAGSGEEYSNLKKVVNELDLEKEVKFTGHLSQKKLRRYLDSSNIGLIPNPENKFTRYCFPLKLLEYLSNGLKVVASNVGDVKELSKIFRNLYIFNCKSYNDLANKIEKSLESRYNKEDINEMLKYKWSYLIKSLNFLNQENLSSRVN